MDLKEFYGMVPKPKASRRSLNNPANAKAIIVNDGPHSQRVMFTTTDDGPVSLTTPEQKISKRVTVNDLDALISDIFDMV